MDINNIYTAVMDMNKFKYTHPETPYMQKLDMAVYCIVNDAEAGISRVVTNKMLETLGMKKEELFAKAKDNESEVVCVNFGDVIGGDENVGMFVICRGPALGTEPFGAGVLAWDDMVKDAIEKSIGTGEFYILPSSIHEVICVGKEGKEPDELRDMIKNVNESIVDDFDRLTDTLYEIDTTKNGTLEIVA